jgi:hypothetical protein
MSTLHEFKLFLSSPMNLILQTIMNEKMNEISALKCVHWNALNSLPTQMFVLFEKNAAGLSANFSHL